MRWLLPAVAAFVFLSTQAQALEIPPRTDRYVNDFAGVIASQDETRLEEFLSRFDRETGNQIVVVTMASLDGLPVEDVTLRIAEAWKPGQAGKDNGVVVGVFPTERKARIEVGYGLEGAIPDATASHILRERMIPHFRDGNWAAGIAAGIETLAAAAKGEYAEPAGNSRDTGFPLWLKLLIPVIFVIFIISQILGGGVSSYGSRGYRHRHYGGGWGGGRGGFGGGFRGGGGGFGGGGASGGW